MQASPLLRHVLQDEAVTRGLGDPEARVLVEWLVDWAELLAAESDSEEEAWAGLRTVCRRARGISRFVALWSDFDLRGAAVQLAACEQLHFPLPTEDEDPAELVARILTWEDHHLLV